MNNIRENYITSGINSIRLAKKGYDFTLRTTNQLHTIDLLAIILTLYLSLAIKKWSKEMSTSIWDFTVNSIQGTPVSFADFKGKVILVVNTASGCGFTPQYKGLQKLYDTYGPEKFVVLGFPCNQFGQQESASEGEIQSFCELNFNVSFPLFQKIEVNGENAAPLYQYLKSSAKGILGSERIKWNFTKFLIDANGKVLERYAPTTKPEAITKKIEELLL